MNKLLLPLLLLTFSFLTSCSHTTAMQFTKAQGGVMVTLPEHHLAVTIPDGWAVAEKAPAGSILLAAGDKGNLRFAITGPLGNNKSTPADSLVRSGVYQKGVQGELLDGKFTKIDRSTITTVAGVEAYRCDASRKDSARSIIQVHLPHKNHILVLSLYSTKQPVSQVTAMTRILTSVQHVP
ncbi:MAG: hypothetical protein U1F71_24440 [Verrucomicrobiaceae bacterium]